MEPRRRGHGGHEPCRIPQHRLLVRRWSPLRELDHRRTVTARRSSLQDAIGLTVAADARTPLCTYCNNRWSFVYGARWSILGGDWEGDNDVVDTVGTHEHRSRRQRVVTELYSGVEYMFCYYGYDLFTRGTVEMQNWRSDVLG